MSEINEKAQGECPYTGRDIVHYCRSKRDGDREVCGCGVNKPWISLDERWRKMMRSSAPIAPVEPNEKLLLCPFCGCAPTDDEDHVYIAICCTNQNCEVQPRTSRFIKDHKQNALQMATDSWNTRAKPQPPQSEVEAVAKLRAEQYGSDPMELEPGDAYGIDGWNHEGAPCHYFWRQFEDEARDIIAALDAVRQTHKLNTDDSLCVSDHAALIERADEYLKWPLSHHAANGIIRDLKAALCEPVESDDIYEDVYEQITDMIEPYVIRGYYPKDNAFLPASVVDSVGTLLKHRLENPTPGSGLRLAREKLDEIGSLIADTPWLHEYKNTGFTDRIEHLLSEAEQALAQKAGDA
jgi:hypothetical protein